MSDERKTNDEKISLLKSINEWMKKCVPFSFKINSKNQTENIINNNKDTPVVDKRNGI